MKFNKAEVSLLAGQPSQKFEKEGVLFVRERQESFFKRNEISVERWCRLRGNLLFYFKSRDQWSEPAGVIVLENVTVTVDNSGMDGTFGILLTFGSNQLQHLSSYTQSERDSWRAAIESASHSKMRLHLQTLKTRLAQKQNPEASVTNPSETCCDSSVIDPDTPPLLECCLSCDNLLCDALGRSPSTRLLVSIRNSSNGEWRMYANTEIVEKTSNPAFMLTIGFRTEHKINAKTQVKICAQDLRERLTMTRTTLGNAFVTLEDLLAAERVRLKLESPNPDGRSAGFVTITSWSVERENGCSTNSTPSHTVQTIDRSSTNSVQRHRRCQSLPPTMHHRFQIPCHPHLLLFYSNPSFKTYKFHSGLGGDISAMEVMAEPKISFAFPQQLLTLWIAEEKELVHEIAGLGELREPWHLCQMSWLDFHLNLINTYTVALENLDNYKGQSFKRSAMKGDPTYEFVPTNLHLQRIWVQNESLRKSGFYDIHTVGAFNAFAQKTNSQGLIKMLKELKSPQKDSTAWCSFSDKLQMAEDSLAAVRKVRREVVDCMRLLMKLAKEKKSDGMFLIVEDMLKKTKLLCNISDTMIVEEALSIWEENKVTVRPEKDEFSESVSEFMQRNKLKIDLQFKPNIGSLQTPNTEFISKELRTPDADYLSPSYDPSRGEFWRGCSVFTSGYQSVDRLSDIDEFEESMKCMSVEDKTRHYYTLFTEVSPMESPMGTPVKVPGHPNAIIEDPQTHEDLLSEDSLLEDNNSLSEESDIDFAIDEEDDESTPHIGSETSKTQSPSSVGNISQKEEAKLQIIEHNDLPPNIEEERNNPVINDNISTQKEDTAQMSQDKLNVEQCKDNKIIPDSLKQKIETNHEDSSEHKANKVDHGIVSDNDSSSPHYHSGDEPEPVDLTHLNIEASMMCLASKVRSICGKANSPTLSNRTFRFKELDSLKKSKSLGNQKNFSKTNENRDTCQESQSDTEGESSSFKIPDVPKPNNGSEEIKDWAGEVRPSMRKLRQGMDSLLKTSRLMCSVLRLQQSKEAVQLTHAIKHRRDVCFSQALTSLVSSLMSRLWCNPPDPLFLTILTQIGPLVCFEGLLSMHGEDVTIINDMIVAIEDLRTVEFTLILVENKKKNNPIPKKASGADATTVASISNFPLPRVTGSRTNLKVLLPVPAWVYTVIPLQDIQKIVFNITPVFFNIGINEQATIADTLGLNGPQERNNSDNLKILTDYIRRFKKMNFFASSEKKPSNIRHSQNNEESLIDDLMSILKNEVSNKKNKNVDILSLCSQICLKLKGVRFTSCKSGKDRTGMSATLEEVNILSREFDLADNEYQKALDTLRSDGTRRINCMKNINVDKYAFKTLQLATFPRQYRPPVGTYGSSKT